MNECNRPLPSSYRDPAGFIFQYENEVYRQVNEAGRKDYDLLLQTGLYDSLTKKKWLISHEEMPAGFLSKNAYKILKPAQIPFISFPYEWSFSMLKEAALLTLRIAKTSLAHGMMLKDATPFNIQWHKGAMIFIDTLSFEEYKDGSPWIAYRQFCECFLSPLLLMHYGRMSLHTMQVAYAEGIPLQLTSRFLPWRSRLSIHTYLHIHLHAKVARKKKGEDQKEVLVPKNKLINLLGSLEMLVHSLSLNDTGTVWGDYYAEAANRNDYLTQKKTIITTWVEKLPALKTAIDFGSNEGEFSLPLAARSIYTIAADADPVAVNKLHKTISETNIQNIIPLIIDFTYPSPAIGLANKERDSFLSRISNTDLGLCLALIHHLCLGKNIPFASIAAILAESCKYLIIEFVPAADEKSKQLLLNKKDIYQWYTQLEFENAFGHHFDTSEKQLIPGTERVLYLMRRSHH